MPARRAKWLPQRGSIINFYLLWQQRCFIVSHNSRDIYYPHLRWVIGHTLWPELLCVCPFSRSPVEGKFTVYKGLYLTVQREWHRSPLSDITVNWLVRVCVCVYAYCICVTGVKLSFMGTWVTTELYRAYFTRDSKTHECFTHCLLLHWLTFVSLSSSSLLNFPRHWTVL